MGELSMFFSTALLFWIVLFVFGVLATTLGLRFLRVRLHHRVRTRDGQDCPVTLRIMLPKFKTEEEAKREDGVQTLKEKIAVAETLYAALGGLKPQHGLRAWLLGRTDACAFEIIAHERLVTFYATVPKRLQEFFEQQIHAQWGGAFIEEIVDYNMFRFDGVVVGGYLVQRREHILPIKTYKDIEADPMNALTNALSKVADGDGVAIQYVIHPAHHGWRSLGARIVRNMQKGMDFHQAKSSQFIRTIFSTKENKEKHDAQLRERRMSPLEQKMVEAIENKINKAGVEVNIRIVASSNNAETAHAYLNNVMQAFGQFNIYEYGNTLVKSLPRSVRGVVDGFIYRLFDERYGVLLNTEEMASLWHLPLHSTDTPNIRWLLARIAPPPANIPSAGLHLGFNEYRGKRTEIYMAEADRRRHMYLIGKTGSGKSEFMKNLIVQDVRAGKGVAVIDPHGDLADGVLELIPKDRIDDVVYFNPSDTDRPMGLNMLEAPNEGMRDFAVQEMINIFMMLFPPEMIGPMFEHNMRNYMLTLMADVENPGTLVEIPRMIADDAFQKRWIAKVKDPVVRSFWEDEMAKTSDYHKSEMMGYLVSKVGRFVENEMMRNIIGQTKSSFNFRDIMDSGKILLVNLSKGKTGEVNASLLGLILVAKLQMAAFTRADIPEPERKDFYLYIDEFQNFVTPSIATILSEARKYRLNLVMAHQYMGQLTKDNKTEIRDAVLGNVGSMFVARVGPEDVEILKKVYEPVFSGYDLMNTDMYTWNVKMIINNAQEKPFT
jgi:ribosomal protein S10